MYTCRIQKDKEFSIRETEVTVDQHIKCQGIDGQIINEEVTVSKQTTSDVYCRFCHNETQKKYFRMTQETFFDHLKRKHADQINSAAKCEICLEKFNNQNAINKHMSKHKELKFKEIVKYQKLAKLKFQKEHIIEFPTKTEELNNKIFIMLREGEVQCGLIEGNNNCYQCIKRSQKSIIDKAHKYEEKIYQKINDVSTQTCVAGCCYNPKGPTKILYSYVGKYKQVCFEGQFRKSGKYC